MGINFIIKYWFFFLLLFVIRSFVQLVSKNIRILNDQFNVIISLSFIWAQNPALVAHQVSCNHTDCHLDDISKLYSFDYAPDLDCKECAAVLATWQFYFYFLFIYLFYFILFYLFIYFFVYLFIYLLFIYYLFFYLFLIFLCIYLIN